MKRFAVSAVLIMLVVMLVGTTPTVMAGKPQDVIEKSNGFPSGPHFNLNIHGKKLDYNCDPTPGGRSAFVCEYGESKIQYISNKKSSVTELLVLDPCSECFDSAPDDNPVKVMLPYKIQLDTGEVIPADGFWVIGRILGKPNHGQDCQNPGPDGKCPSSIIWDSNVVKQACNDDGSEEFGDYTSCDEVALGLIVGTNLYLPGPDVGVYERFEPGATKAKGNSSGTDMTPLFTYTGWVSWGACPDTDGNGEITSGDIPVDWATRYDPSPDLDGDTSLDVEEWILYHPDTNCDGVIDQEDVDYFVTNGPTYGLTLDMDGSGEVTVEDWHLYQETLGHSSFMIDQWIFNIADLVLTEQGFVNDGTKLFQIRFYPRATTEFVPE